MSKTRELIITPKVSQAQLTKFLPQLEAEGIKMVYLDPKKIGKKKIKLQTIFPSSAAKYVVIEEKGTSKPKGKKVGRKFKVLSNSDIENILSAAKKGLDFVIIEVKDWKIIPLENIIAKLHKIHTKIFTIARTPKEVRKMFSISEFDNTLNFLPTCLPFGLDAPSFSRTTYFAALEGKIVCSFIFFLPIFLGSRYTILIPSASNCGRNLVNCA